MANINPSNQLYHGEATDIREVFRGLIQQYDNEIRRIRRIRTKSIQEFPEDSAQRIAALEEQIAAVEQCRREYMYAIAIAAGELFQRWAASEKEAVARIGTAGLAHDFSKLAL